MNHVMSIVMFDDSGNDSGERRGAVLARDLIEFFVRDVAGRSRLGRRAACSSGDLLVSNELLLLLSPDLANLAKQYRTSPVR